MQKCTSCSYVTLGDAECCNHCGAPFAPPFAPPTALVGAVPSDAPAETGEQRPAGPSHPPVAGPEARATPDASGALPDAAHVAPAPSIDWSAPGRVAAVPGFAAGGFAGATTALDRWSTTAPATAAPPARKPRRLLLALVIAIAAMLGGAAARAALAGAGAIPSGTGEFVAGRGTSYTSPDQTFTAGFPSTPTVQQQSYTAGSLSATLYMAQVQTDDYEIVAASIVLPGTLRSDQIDAVLHDVLEQGAESQHATIHHEQRVTHDGASGLEVRAKVPDGYDARLMAVSNNGRVYLLGVHAKVGTGRLYDALVDSFDIT